MYAELEDDDPVVIVGPVIDSVRAAHIGATVMREERGASVAWCETEAPCRVTDTGEASPAW